MHGSACEIAKKEKQKEANEDETSEQYVNLLDSKKEAPKKDRDDLIQSLALKLRELDVVNSGPKTKNKGARRKELREMKALEKMLRKRKEESSRKMKEEALGTDDSEEKSKKATDEEGSEKRKRKADRQKRKPDGKKGSYRRVRATFRESPKEHRKQEQSRRKDDVVSPPETPKEEIKENIMDVLNKEEPSRQFKPPPPRSRRTEESSESRHTDDSSKKSIKKDELDISPSASKRLLDDIDESGARKNKRKERRERMKREKKDKREKQEIEPKMFESIRNIMPSDPDQVEKEKKMEDMSKSDSTKTPTPQSLTGLAKSVYIGVCNFAKAEEQVTKRSDFRVYHQLAHRPLLDDLEQELPLIVVYRTANGSFRHYPIRRRKVGTSSYYYVDYGDPKVQTHASLDHLVRYYQINAQRHPENGQYADQFPWWEVHL